MFTATLTTKDGLGQTSSESIEIEVLENPVHLGDFNIIYSGTTYPQTVVLDASLDNDEIYKYEWTINGEDSIQYHPVKYHQITEAQTLSVTLTVTNLVSNVSHSKTKTAIFDTSLSDLGLTFSTNSTIAETIINFQVLNDQLYDKVRINFGDGTIKNLDSNQSAHKYKSAGLYNITVEGFSNGGGATLVKHYALVVADDKSPVIGFNVNKLKGIVPLTVNIENELILDDSDFSQIRIDYGDGRSENVSNTFDLDKVYNEPGLYVIKLTAIDSDGIEVSSQKSVLAIRANDDPNAKFSVDKDFGNPHLDVNFDASLSSDETGIEFYLWEFGDGFSKQIESPYIKYTYTEPGFYTARLTTIDLDGRTDSVQKTIRVNSGPQANFTVSVTGDQKPFTLNLNASASSDDVSGLTYRWYMQDGTELLTTTDPISQVVLDRDGSDSVFLAVTDSDGYKDKTSKIISLNRAPVARGYVSPMLGDYPLNINYNASASVDDNSGLSYKWSLNDVLLSSSKTGQFTLLESGMNLLRLEVTDSHGLVDSKEYPITVFSNPNPIANFTFNLASSIVPAKLELDAISSSDDKGIIQYQWQVGSDSPFITNSPKTDYTQMSSGIIPVTLTVTDTQGSTASFTQNITFTENQLPIASFTSSLQSGEKPLKVVFDASSSTSDDDLEYRWNFSDGTQVINDSSTISHVFTSAGSFDVVLEIVDTLGQSSTSTDTIIVTDPTITDLEIPQIVSNIPEKFISQDETSIMFTFYDNEGVNYDTLEVYRDNTPLDTSLYSFETTDTIKVDFLDQNAISQNQRLNLSVRVSDINGNYSAKSFIYNVVESIPEDIYGPIYNFHPEGGVLSSTTLDLDIFTSDLSGINYASLIVKLNDEIITSDKYSVDTNLGKITVHFNGSYPLPESNYNIIEVSLEDTLGNIGIGKLGLDTIEDEVIVLSAGNEYLGQPLSGLGYDTGFFITTTGDVKCVGGNYLGKCGAGISGNVGEGIPVENAPVVGLGAKAIQVSGGLHHACALLVNGTARCWGYGSYGQLGLPGYTIIGDNELPSSLPALSLAEPITKVVANYNKTCLIYGEGKLRCFGDNRYGELGQGHLNDLGDDESLGQIPDIQVGGLVKDVAISVTNICAVLEDNSVKCWGYNGPAMGQISSEIIGDDETPFGLGAIDFGRNDLVKISSMNGAFCALFATGDVKCWGNSDGYGTIGTGSTQTFPTVSQYPYVNLGKPAKDLFSKSYIACVLFDDGNGRCWGKNTDGQLGLSHTNHIGDNEFPSSTIEIDFNEKIVSFLLNDSSTCAVLENKKARCWGRNDNGQLGFDITEPVIIGDDETYLSSVYVGIPDDIDISLYGAQEGVPQNLLAPVINADKYFGQAPLAINFDANNSMSAHGEITNYAWDFGDGNTGSGPLVSHTYQNEGVYKVTLTITDELGNQDFTETPINATGEQILPLASMSASDKFSIIGSSVTFDGSDSIYSKSNIAFYEWYVNSSLQDTTTVDSYTHTFNQEGAYTVELIVVGDDGARSKPYYLGHVAKPENYLPEGQIDCTQNLTQFNCSIANLRDRDGKITLINWSMDDGSEYTGESISHSYSQGGNGSFLIKAEIFDDKEAKTVLTKLVSIDELSPVISSDIQDGDRLLGARLDYNITISDDSDTLTEVYVSNDKRISTNDKNLSGYLFLNEGMNIVKIVSTDMAGNASTIVQYNVEVRDDAPDISILTSDNQLVNNGSFQLDVVVNDETQTRTSIVLNNQVVAQDLTSPSLSEVLNLEEGINFIEIISFDEIGQMSRESLVNITLDTTPPEITLEEPDNTAFIIGKDTVKFKGFSSEQLSSLMIGEDDVPLSGNNFNFNKVFTSEGQKIVEVRAVDLAGNETVRTVDFELATRLLFAELMTIEPFNNGLKIKGKEGATRFPNQEVEISTGFFGDKTITSDHLGRFEVVISFANEIDLSTRYDLWDYDEEITLDYNADTTFAGAVHDVNGNPLPGVTVTILDSNQETVTGIDGRFEIIDPVVGNQQVLIDGTSVDESYDTNKRFSKIVMDLSFGHQQRNALDRIIYLAPMKIDESFIVEDGVDQTVTVSDPELAEFSLEIKAGNASFPSGTQIDVNGEDKNIISASVVPIDKTSIEVHEVARPDFVYALEPSGTTFTERAPLSLPNVNEFEEGTRLAILSKNSQTGKWEVDGSATVRNNRVETIEGGGISHFSEVYVAPYGTEISKFGDSDKVGISESEGAVSTSIALPSYKRFGQDITPNFVYNSTWANPNAVVTNIFDLSEQMIKSDPETEVDNTLVFGGSTSEVSVKSWTTPEEIESNFYISNLQSNAFFNIDKAPEKAVVSYAVNLDSLDTGLYPARAAYKITYKHMVIVTVKTQTSFFGIKGSKGKKELDPQISFFDIFPEDVNSVLYVQNRKQSEFGAGWKLGLNEKIVNPESSRIVLEEADGSTSNYVLDNTIETLFYDKNGIDSASLDSSEQLKYYSGHDRFYELVASNDGKYSKRELYRPSKYVAKMGANMAYWEGIKTVDKDFPDTSDTYYEHKYRCEKGYYKLDTPKQVRDIYDIDGIYYYLDRHGAIFQNNGTETHIAGRITAPPTYFKDGHKHRPPFDAYCEKHSFIKECTKYRKVTSGYERWKKYHRTSNTSSRNYRWRPTFGKCERNPHVYSTGSIPRKGHATGTLKNTQFRDPRSMAFSKTEDGIVYIADRGNNIVKKLDLNANQSSIFAGNRKVPGDQLHADKVNPTSVAIYNPRAVETDLAGNVYIASADGMIRVVDPNGKISILAGRNNHLQANAELTNTLDRVKLRNPSGLAYDEDHNFLYVSDRENHRVVRLDLNEGISVTIAGTTICSPGIASAQSSKIALNASICRPEKIGLDEKNNLLILDKTNKMIRRVNFSFGNGENSSIAYVSLDNDGSKLKKYNNGNFDRIFRDGRVNVYDKNGLQLSAIDKLGNQVDFFYDQDGKLIELKDLSGDSLVLTYSGNRLSSMTDPANRTTNFTYNGNKLDNISYPDGTSESFTYFSDGRLQSHFNKRSYETRYSYNSQKRLKEIKRIDHDSGRIITTKYKNGVADTIVDNSNGIPTVPSYGDGNEEGNELTDILTDANGIETELKKGFDGYVAKITTSDGRYVEIDRDEEGRPVSITKDDGEFTKFQYNDLGDLICKYESRTELEENYVYNSDGNLLEKRNALGVQNFEDACSYDENDNFIGTLIVSNFYDNNGLLIKSVNVDGIESNRSYLENGLLESAFDKYGNTTRYKYDSKGNLIRKILPKGEVVDYQRDLAGNIINRDDSKGIEKAYTYDDFNRLTSVSTGITADDPVGKLTTYDYSQSGQLLKIIDPKQNITDFDYDGFDRLVYKKTPLGQETFLDYDGNGNVVYQKDPNGNETDFEYNFRNQVTRKVMVDNTYDLDYDDDGNLEMITENDTRIDLTYEEIRGEFYVKTAKTTGVNGLNLPNPTFTYFYDDFGNRTSMSTPYGSDFVYEYNEASKRLNKITNHKGEVFSFEYDDANRISKLITPSYEADYAYDVNSFLESISYSKNSNIMNFFNYQRDPNGNRTKITTSSGEFNYGYDEENQLTWSQNPENNEETFNYDDLGNRLNDQLGSYTYDNKSQRLTEDYNHIYFYDTNGNLTSIQEKGMVGNYRNLNYSSENQLVKIDTYENNFLIKEVAYKYDGLGRRVAKEIVDHQVPVNSYVRSYVYDNQEILAEYDENNTTLAVYTHSTQRTDDTLAIDVKSTKIASNLQSYFFVKDALGSIIDITDSNGNVIQHYSYSSFGKLLKITDSSNVDITSTPTIKNSFTFTNREYDEESGLMYYRARFYMPEIGRFVSEDPHSGKLLLPKSVNNKFAYVANNPMKFVDPSGKIFVSLLIGAVISGAVNAAFSGGPFLEAFGRGFLQGLGAGLSVITGSYLIGGIATFLGASSSVATLAAGVGGAIGSYGFAYNQGARGAGLFVATAFGFGAGLTIGAGAFGGFKAGKAADYLQQSVKSPAEGISNNALSPSPEAGIEMLPTESSQGAGIPGLGVEYPKELCVYVNGKYICTSY